MVQPLESAPTVEVRLGDWRHVLLEYRRAFDINQRRAFLQHDLEDDPCPIPKYVILSLDPSLHINH